MRGGARYIFQIDRRLVVSSRTGGTRMGVSTIVLAIGLMGVEAAAVGQHGNAREETKHMQLQTDVKGQGAPLVLVGGGLTGWQSWVPHQERLAPTRKVVRMQLLAVEYGLENRPLPAGYNLETESDALAAAIEQLGLKGPVDLVAW